MYSLEERLLAVKTYYEMGRNAKATVRRLGYPDETSIAHWVKEYERNHNLHEHRVRYGEIILQEWVPGFQFMDDPARKENYRKTLKSC